MVCVGFQVRKSPSLIKSSHKEEAQNHPLGLCHLKNEGLKDTMRLYRIVE